MPAKMIGGRLLHWCDVCVASNAPWGYGRRMWACGEHREEVEAAWVAAGSPA